MANLNFITTNTVPGISDQIARQSIADRQADEQSMRTRYDHEEKVRGAKALNDAINAVQAKQLQPAPVAAPQPVRVPELNVSASDPMAQESANLPPANAGQRVTSPISQITTQPQRLTRQDLIGALGTDRATAPQRFALMQQEVVHGEQQDVTRKQEQNKAADRVFEMLKTNDPTMLAHARELAKQSGMNIPDQIFTDRILRANLIGRVDMFHKSGIRGDQIPAAYKAYQNSTKPDEEGRFMDALSGVPSGLAWKPNAPKSAGGGDSGHATAEERNFNLWLGDNSLNPQQRAEKYKEYLNAKRSPKQDVRGRMIMNALKIPSDSGYGTRFKTQEEAAAAVDQALRSGSSASPSPSPAPSNRIRFDAQGNRIP